MLTSVEGTYRNGQIQLNEPLENILSETAVIVTFMSSTDIDMRTHGISQDQASDLRAALSTFADWDGQDMELYDDYDAAKSGN